MMVLWMGWAEVCRSFALAVTTGLEVLAAEWQPSGRFVVECRPTGGRSNRRRYRGEEDPARPIHVQDARRTDFVKHPQHLAAQDALFPRQKAERSRSASSNSVTICWKGSKCQASGRVIDVNNSDFVIDINNSAVAPL